jgi:hypothetical protein
MQIPVSYSIKASESGAEAADKRWEEDNGSPSDNAIHDKDVPDSYSTTSEMRLPSAEGSGIGRHGSATREELADRFGVSSSTLDRVSTILDQGTPEQIQSLRDKVVVHHTWRDKWTNTV